MRQDRPSDPSAGKVLRFERPPAPAGEPGPVGTADPRPTLLLVAAGAWDRVKLAPVLTALEERAVFTPVLVEIGGPSEVLAPLPLPVAPRRLEVGPGTRAERTAAMLVAFEGVLAEETPVAVLVVGDTDGALAAALVSTKEGIPVAHLEAGLRSGDWSTPDEINRVVIDRLSDVLFAQSPEGPENLAGEGVGEHQVHEVGSTLIDSLRKHERAARAANAAERLGVPHGEYVLALLHRPANVSDAERVGGIAAALLELAAHAPVVYPVTPGTRALLTDAEPALRAAGVRCVEPLGYVDLLSLVSDAGAVLTDVGEHQEHAAAFGVGCFTLGDFTERPVTIARGTNLLLGPDVAAIAEVRPSPLPPTPCVVPQWDGNAGNRVAQTLTTQYALMSAFALGVR